jgi:hypothetical protein
MSNEVFHDETRARFEQAVFPDHVTAQYIGRMNSRSSLGRYVLAISPHNVPVKVDTLEVRPLQFQELLHGLPDNAREQIICHEFDTTYSLLEPVSAIYAVYRFFNIWGELVGGFDHQTIQDHSNKLQVSHRLAYDMLDGEINAAYIPKVNSIISDMTPVDFHICVLGITSCRSKDGMLFAASQAEIEDVLTYVMPRG